MTNLAATLKHPALQLNVRFSDGQSKVIQTAAADANLFPLFHISPKVGRLFRADENSSRATRTALLGLNLWRAQFKADPNIVGTQLLVNDRYYTVVGVLNADIPSFEDVGLWLNRVNEIEDILHNNEHLHIPFTVFAAIKGDFGVKDVESELNIYYSALSKDEPNRYANTVADVVPMSRHILANAAEATRMLSYLGTAIVALGLVNAMLLLTVSRMRLRTANQIRATLGLPMAWFRAESILETGLLVVLGLFFAAACQNLAKLVLPYFTNRTRFGSLANHDWFFVLILGGLLILILTAPQLSYSLKKTSRHRKAFLFALVFLETSTVTIVLYLSGVTLQVLVEAQSEIGRGYQTKNLVGIRYRTFGEKYLDRESQQRFEAKLRQKMKEIPEVSDVTYSCSLPLMDTACFIDYLYPSHVLDRDSSHEVEIMIVGANFFDMFGVKLLAGEPFTMGGAPDSIIIDSDAAKLVPCEAFDCIGKPVRLLNKTFTIVAVNRPVKFRHAVRPQPQVHIRWDQTILAKNQTAVIIKTSLPPSALLPKIREASAKVDPNMEPLRIDKIDDLVEEGTQQERMMLNACLVIGLFGLFASAIGIFVVTSQIIESQRRECGIRMALGDTAAGVARVLCGPVVLWAIFGVVFGILTATVVQDKLAATLYLKKGFDFTAAMSAFLIVGSTICIGLFVPVQTIARINAADLLKTMSDDSGTRG